MLRNNVEVVLPRGEVMSRKKRFSSDFRGKKIFFEENLYPTIAYPLLSESVIV